MTGVMYPEGTPRRTPGKVYFYVHADDGRGKEVESMEDYVIINAVPELYLPMVTTAPLILFLTRKLRK